jgi:hypothetical protein
MSQDVVLGQRKDLTVSKHDFKNVVKNVEDLFTDFPGLGKDQSETGARAGDASQWTMSSIIAAIDSKGWDDGAGPTPVYRVGDRHPRIGNRRCTALALLHKKEQDALKPGQKNKWSGVKVKMREYPQETPDSVMDEIVAAEIRSTEVHTRRDLVTLGCTFKLRNPGASQRQVAEYLGVEKLEKFNTFKEGALEVGADGVKRIKTGIPDTKVFRQKDIIMEAIAAAKAIPEVRKLFLEPTEKRYINADELYAANQAWEQDVKSVPSLATAQTLKEVAEKHPKSLLLGQVGPIALGGRETGAGPTPGGKRALSQAGRKAAQNSLGICKSFNCLFQFFDGLPGAQGEVALKRLEVMRDAVNVLVNRDSSPESRAKAIEAYDEAAKQFADSVDLEAAKLAAALTS